MKPKTLVLLVAAAAFLAAAADVQAQSYPTKLIKIIVPQPPGGNVGDIQSRLISPILSKRLGQPVIVENRPGAGGTIGTGVLAKSPPDGYTLASGQGGPIVVLPHTSKNVPYDSLKDFAPIAMTTRNFMNIYAHPQPAVQDAARDDRLREGQSRQDDRGHQRRRRLSASDLRAPAHDGRFHLPSHPLQGLLPGRRSGC